VAFLHPKYLQVCPSQAIVPNPPPNIPPYSIQQIMDAYWKPKTIKYKYSWFTDTSASIYVTGSGETTMTEAGGAKNKKSDLVCPQIRIFSATQQVTYFSEGNPPENANDQVTLTIDLTKIVTQSGRIVDDGLVYSYPHITLVVQFGRLPYLTTIARSWRSGDPPDISLIPVTFFGGPPATISPVGLSATSGAEIEISIDEETENA